MEYNLWDIEEDPVESKELTENEKKIAEECSEIDLEFKEAISMIQDAE